ncbi:hypothetical protein CPLU01_02495 [Colletotrichum plurivorum]|uniref:DUF7708 domain-containing protein n=1 Tax=Colletotrichum plurivorum TaxID=2175906 RepID=A0A8H6NMM0_9PEZI|nr:hypothetical protein CPLU01_02495 [Colletotrichum plurivorum]
MVIATHTRSGISVSQGSGKLFSLRTGPVTQADRHDIRWTDPAKTAYDSAIDILRKELTADEYQDIQKIGHNSLKDVQTAVGAALEGYRKRTKGHKVRAWLASCSSRVMYYGAIFDTFAQHHPEYVSLAWGTLKFLFVAVLNHEELLTEIPKAISRIADVLPRTELHSVLYPTQRMQDAVSQLYAKIIEFFLMAIRWYKRGRLSHSIRSIVEPFSLGFKPIIDEITERSRRVDELANAASKAELRDLHVSVRGLNDTVLQLTEMSTLISQSLLAFKEESKQIFQCGQLEEIRTTILLEDTPMADDSLAWCRSMRNRRRHKAPTQILLSEISKLETWASSPTSMLLLAQGKGVRTSSLDFATDFLDIIAGQGLPSIWALPSTVNGIQGGSSEISVSGVLRSLISQLLVLNPALVTEGVNPLTAKHFRTATTIRRWLQLFETCTSDFRRLFVVIDMGVIETACRHEEAEDQLFNLTDFFEEVSRMIQRRRSGGLKIIVVSWRFEQNSPLDNEDIFGVMRVFTDRERKVERLMKNPKFRSTARRGRRVFTKRLTSAISVE